VTREAVEEFVAALTADRLGAGATGPGARRREQIERAERELDRIGI
jgi:hypothetical protein